MEVARWIRETGISLVEEYQDTNTAEKLMNLLKTSLELFNDASKLLHNIDMQHDYKQVLQRLQQKIEFLINGTTEINPEYKQPLQAIAEAKEQF